MSIPDTGQRERRPTNPGEILREDFMPDYTLTVAGLAKALGISRQNGKELIHERRARFLARSDRSGFEKKETFAFFTEKLYIG